MEQSTEINDKTIREMDRVKAWCIIIVNDKRQDALVDDKLCDKEIGQQYVQKDALPMII